MDINEQWWIIYRDDIYGPFVDYESASHHTTINGWNNCFVTEGTFADANKLLDDLDHL